MIRKRKLGRGVAVVGAGMSKFGVLTGWNCREMFVEAVKDMQKSVDRGFDIKDIEANYVGCCGAWNWDDININYVEKQVRRAVVRCERELCVRFARKHNKTEPVTAKTVDEVTDFEFRFLQPIWLDILGLHAQRNIKGHKNINAFPLKKTIGTNINGNVKIPKNPEPNAGLGGRSEIAAVDPDGNEIGKHKVMSLRNIALTPPYGHNGVFATLEQTVHFYNTRDTLGWLPDNRDSGFATAGWPDPEIPQNVNHDELGNLGLTNDEEQAIVAFMLTLTDDYQKWGKDPRVPPRTPSPFAYVKPPAP